MADTPKRLVGPVALGTSAATVYTVPGATKAILRNLHVANTSAGALSFTCSIGADAAGTRYYHEVEIQPDDALDWSGFLPLEATEILQAYGSAAGLTLTIGGVEVT